jgi:uncharacterized protein YqgC (DUF456 family)
MIPAISTTTLILVGITVFSIGLLLGWLYTSDSEETTSNKLQLLVAVVVTLVWVAATISGILIAGYTVSPMLHALMGAIVGYFFTENGIEFNIGRSK